LDDGRLTDAQGRTVNFKNTIVIMTSNVGSPLLLEGVDREGHIRDDVRQSVMNELRSRFRPEFLNRLDEIILFKPLTQNETGKIVELNIKELVVRLKEQGLKLEVDRQAIELIAREGYDPVYGARPLKRLIRQEVETPVARRIIAGDIGAKGVVRVVVSAGKLAIEV
jgi:ATP-dependent Clp protease ATP-binding subunit ClpB